VSHKGLEFLPTPTSSQDHYQAVSLRVSQSLEYYTGNLYPARSLAPRLKTPPIAKVSPSA